MLFDVLDAKTPIFGHYFLEASAGTGKTFAIENIVPRLLLESKIPMGIESILVVTFTRAATRELKGRIYKNLLMVASALEKGDGGPGYLEAFYKSSPEVLRSAKRKVEEALFSFEKAQIFTLHSFCLSVLEEFAFDAHFFMEGKEKETAEKTELLREYIKDFLRRGIKPELLSSFQLRRICTQRRIGKDVEALVDSILKIVEKEQDIHFYLSAKQQWEAWNEALLLLSRKSSQELWDELSLVSPRLVKSQKWISQIRTFFSFVEKGFCLFSEWDGFLGEKEFFLGQKELAKKNFLGEARALFLTLFEEATNPKKLLLQLARASKANYSKGKKDLSFSSPDDFVIRLKKALQNENFKEKVRNKYKALIIDEFQDTDLQQWTIFNSLFLTPGYLIPVVYLVGDPKQSIYGFRSADVYIYLKARSVFSEGSHFYLGTNFRSHPDLVHALNMLFSFGMPARWMLLPFTGESLEVRSVDARPWPCSLLQEETKGRIHFFLKEVSEENKVEVEEDFLIPYMAEEIIRLQKERGIPFEKIAVLVKDRFQGARLQKGFKEYGIPCRMQKSFSIKSVAYEGMKSLVEALVYPTDLSVIKKFLGSALMGYSSLDILGSWENLLLQKKREYLMDAAFFMKKKGFGSFFSYFLASPSAKEGKTVGQELLSREDPSLYFDLRQLFQILLAESPSSFYDPEAILTFLEEMKRMDPTSDLFKQLLEEEEQQVQVMTLHKSKGLEFEIVFALALASRFTGKEDFISVRKEDGRELRAFEEEEKAYLLHAEEIDAEKLRHLYVALTRAKERVYVPYILYKNPKEIDRASAAPIELFLHCFGLSECSFSDIYQKILGSSLTQCISQLGSLGSKASISYEIVPGSFSSKEIFSIKEEVLFPPTPFLFSYKEDFIFSFSSLIQEGKKESFSSKDIIASSFALPPGAETGTVMHFILESLCKAGLHQKMDVEAFALVLKGCKGTCLETKEEIVFTMLKDVMDKEIVTPSMRFCLKEVDSSAMQMEMEFLYPIGSSLIKGFIDLVFRFKGKYFLLDWKTNILGLEGEEYEDAKVRECMVESRYDLQAAIYAAAIKKMLAIFEENNFESFEGAIYFFLRGKNPYFFYPDFTLLQKLGEGEL